MTDKELKELEESAKKGELTPEQIEKLRETYVRIAAAASELFEHLSKVMMDAIKPIMDYYNSLPEDLKQELAKTQVKEQFIENRLKDYEKYWNPEKQIFEIEDDWNPTRDELLDSISKGWDFENAES